MHIQASEMSLGWKRDFFSYKHRSAGSGQIKKLQVPIPWTKDNCPYTIKKKITTFFEEHIDVYFNGDVKAAKEKHAEWQNSFKERKREIKEKHKQRVLKMDSKERVNFRFDLLRELKE